MKSSYLFIVFLGLIACSNEKPKSGEAGRKYYEFINERMTSIIKRSIYKECLEIPEETPYFNVFLRIDSITNLCFENIKKNATNSFKIAAIYLDCEDSVLTIFRDSLKLFIPTADRIKKEIEQIQKNETDLDKIYLALSMLKYLTTNECLNVIKSRDRFEIIPINAVIKDEKTATTFAELVLFEKYGQKLITLEKPYKVSYFNGVWTFSGTSKGKPGGTFYLKFNPIDCRIIELHHY